MPGSTNICFTWNNPPVVEGNVVQPKWDDDTMLYLVYQYEQGAQGTYHWQGYVELKNRKTFNQLKRLMLPPGLSCHMENRRGSQQQAIDYCKKSEGRVPEAVPYEFGTPKESNQGSRTDIIEFRDAIRSGKRTRELVEEHPMSLARYGKFAATVRSLYRPEKEEPCKIYLLIGPPGCGKTRSVMEQFKGPTKDDLFKVPLNGKTMWFDGYDGQDNVLIDDFAGAASHITLSDCLRLLDPWGVEQVQVKGSFVWWNPKRIFITTNIWPREWYKWENRVIQYQALARRFRCVFDFYEYEIGANPPIGDNDCLPYIHEDYITHGISLQGCACPPRYEGKDWWIRERPDDAVPW